MLRYLARFPKPAYYILTIVLFPFICLVDGIGFLTGLMKVGDPSTWNDELMRITHNARNIEISIGMMSFVYLGIVPFVYYVFATIFSSESNIPDTSMVVYSTVWGLYAAFAFFWSVRHNVNPIDGTRDLDEIED